MTIWNAYIHRVILVRPNSKRLCCAWPAFAPLRCQYMFILRMQHFSPKACNAHLIHSSKQRSVIQWNIKINIHAPNQQKPSQKRQRFQNHATHATCIALNCDMLYHIHSDAILAVSTLNPPPPPGLYQFCTSQSTHEHIQPTHPIFAKLPAAAAQLK